MSPWRWQLFPPRNLARRTFLDPAPSLNNGHMIHEGLGRLTDIINKNYKAKLW